MARKKKPMSDTEKVRDLIEKGGLSQRAAARELGINDRTMRGYCAGAPISRVVILALERVVDLKLKEGLKND